MPGRNMQSCCFTGAAVEAEGYDTLRQVTEKTGGEFPVVEEQR